MTKDVEEKHANKKKKKKEKRKKKQSEAEEGDDDETKTKKKVKEGHVPHESAGPKEDCAELALSDDEMKERGERECVSLLLFYQYVSPVLSGGQYRALLQHVDTSARRLQITGRMRVAAEGLNCTLTGPHANIRRWCRSLQQSFTPYFDETDFKFTDPLPEGQSFPRLTVLRVTELVHYDLPPSSCQQTGIHLRPKDYHHKMMNDPDTVLIDVRNHYETAIGRFQNSVHPNMRKSTDFPKWLKRNLSSLHDKQVLMYCTGGVRCERASSLLLHQANNNNIRVKGVYQLRGGIDQYFREFPDGGGMWKGKNYTFDKRFSHAPPSSTEEQILGHCRACHRPWDKYRGKKRCPTCGIPLLLCTTCLSTPNNNNNNNIRCELCVEQGITSKRQWKELERAEQQQHDDHQEQKKKSGVPNNDLLKRESKEEVRDGNDTAVSRVVIKNMNVQQMTQSKLLDMMPEMTHLYWIRNKEKKWFGSALIELKTARDARRAVEDWHGKVVHGRPLVVRLDPVDPKDHWPIPTTKISPH